MYLCFICFFTLEQQGQQLSALTFRPVSSSSSYASFLSSATLSSSRNQRTHEVVICLRVFWAYDGNISSSGAAAIDESLVFGSSDVVYARYGDYLKFVKKIIATKLHRPQILERSRGVRAEELQWFYNRILDKARKNGNAEISKEATMLINNILCRMSMGRSFSEENVEAERVRGLVDESYALAKKIFFASTS